MMIRNATSLIKILVFYEYARTIVLGVCAILLLSYCVHPGRFASHYSFIRAEDIYMELDKSYSPRDNSCSIAIKGSTTRLHYPNQHLLEDPAAMARRLDILPGS